MHLEVALCFADRDPLRSNQSVGVARKGADSGLVYRCIVLCVRKNTSLPEKTEVS